MLEPYQRAILYRVGIRGSTADWYTVQYTLGTVDDSGPLRLVATDGTLGIFVSASNELCYHLGPIAHFTGTPMSIAFTPKSQPQTKPKRQHIIDSL